MPLMWGGGQPEVGGAGSPGSICACLLRLTVEVESWVEITKTRERKRNPKIWVGYDLACEF